MNIIQQPVIFASTPDHNAVAPGIVVTILAITLLCLALDSNGRDCLRSTFSQLLHADYWMRRARRRESLMRMLSGIRSA